MFYFDIDIFFLIKLEDIVFLKFNNTPYQAGEYYIYNKSLFDIHNIFINGDTVTYELKIIPGMNIYDINSLIDKTSLINDCINLICINNSFDFNLDLGSSFQFPTMNDLFCLIWLLHHSNQ